MRHSFKFLAAFAAIAPLAGTANAAIITLTNSSFESPVAGDGGWITGAPTGWVWNGMGTVAVMDENRSAVNTAPHGVQWGFTANNGAQLGQAIGSGLELLNHTFEVSYFATRRNNENVNLKHDVLIMAGSDSTFVGGDVLDTVNYNTNLASQTSVSSITLNLETPANYAGLNTRLWLVFENQVQPVQGNAQFMIDRVEVSATAIPEPSALTLLVAGVLGLMCLRRRR